jgi:predicted transcriptional regulator
MSLVKSIISKKDSDNKIDIANLEDMLKQLNEMGFTDRESNLKLVKFHNQFKEGLDEVVEALLTQSQLETVNNTEVSVSSH